MCGLKVKLENGQIAKVLPDKNHPVHHGFACHKGIDYLDIHRDPDRLNYPTKRTNPRSDDKGEFKRVSWDDAISEIAEKINSIRLQHGDTAIGAYMGQPTANNSRVIGQFPGFLARLGSDRFFSALTQDCANKNAASEQVFGSLWVHPIPDLLHTKYFLTLGCNPQVSQMSYISVSNPMKKIRAIKKRGGRVVFIAPRVLESSRTSTGETILIAPDTDVYFLAAMLFVILVELETDLDPIRERTTKNLDALIEFVRRYSPERVSSVTGIESDIIRQIASDFSQAPSASIHMSTGANMGRQGTLTYWLLQMISLATGNLGRRGGNIFSPGYMNAAAFGKRQSDNPFHSSNLGEIRHIGGTLPGNRLADFINDEREPLRALVVQAGNPLLSIGGGQDLRESFNKLELLVVIDIYRNATGEIADYVLPATDAFERADISSIGQGTQLERYVQYTDALVLPKAERRFEWDIYHDLECALGTKPPEQANEQSFDQLELALKSANLSIEDLRSQPSNTMLLPVLEPDEIYESGIHNDDDKIDCCPNLFAEALALAEEIFEETKKEPADQLKLIIGRNTLMHNSWQHNVQKYKRRVHVTNPIWLHPDDAAARDIQDGDVVCVASEHGRLEAECRINPALKSGVVTMVHGWGNQNTHGMGTAKQYPGVNYNALLPTGISSYERLSNQAHMTGINVTIDKGPTGTLAKEPETA